MTWGSCASGAPGTACSANAVGKWAAATSAQGDGGRTIFWNRLIESAASSFDISSGSRRAFAAGSSRPAAAVRKGRSASGSTRPVRSSAARVARASFSAATNRGMGELGVMRKTTGSPAATGEGTATGKRAPDQ